MTIQIKAGSTSRKVEVAVFDIATGLPYTTAAYNDAGISLWYRRGVVGAKTAITPATQTVTGAYSSGGFVAVGNGRYRLDLPDAALAAGVDEVEIGGGATAWHMIAPTVQLVGYDPRTELTTAVLAFIDAAVSSRSTYAGTDTSGTTTLLSRITALLQTKAEADTAHGLLATAAALSTVAGYIDTEVAAIKAKTDNLPTDPADQSQVEAAITAAIALIADAVWDELLSGHATAGSAGHYLTDAGGAADPMMASPSDYDAGTLGYLIGRLAGGRITVRGMVTPTGDMDEIVGGADYSASDGYSFDWTDADSEVAWPDLTGATVTWHGRSPDGQETTLSMTVVTPTGDKVVRLALTASQAAALVTTQTGLWTFTVWATLSPSGRVRPLVRGTVPVIELVGP